MKTKVEIDNLKAGWKSDPCWDIEDTEGFEEHKTELAEWRAHFEAEWQIREDNRIAARAKLLECSPALVRYLENLERRIDEKAIRLDALEQHNFS
jgi:hypothetical protein